MQDGNGFIKLTEDSSTLVESATDHLEENEAVWPEYATSYWSRAWYTWVNPLVNRVANLV